MLKKKMLFMKCIYYIIGVGYYLFVCSKEILVRFILLFKFMGVCKGIVNICIYMNNYVSSCIRD